MVGAFPATIAFDADDGLHIAAFDRGDFDLIYYFEPLPIATGAAPVAAFSCTPIAGVRNSTRTCTDASTNTPTSWDWFGAPSNPCIGYNTTIQSPNIFPLNYSWCSICLIATNAQGSDTECKTNYLYVSQPWVG